MALALGAALPGLQAVQEVDRDLLLKVPGWQREHCWAPVLAEKLPGGQNWQPVWPTRLLAVPTGLQAEKRSASGTSVISPEAQLQ